LRIEGWARDGLTDKQIAQNIGISVATLYRWQTKFCEICEAIKRGKAPVDQQVENALLKRALGFVAKETRTDSAGNTQVIEKDVPPDTTAGIFWLKKRMKDKWDPSEDKQTEDTKLYELPARVIARSFSDINRTIVPNKSYVFKGGRGSTKSSFISLKIIELLINNPDMHACVVRKVAGTLKDSVYAQMKWAIRELGKEADFDYKLSPLEIRYKKSKQTIYFRGLDDPIKLKSIKPEFGYIGILWIEERDQLAGPAEERSVKQSVLRGGSESYDFVSFNPPKTNSNWVNREELVPDPNRIVHNSNYLDVPPEWLGQKFLDDAQHLKEVNPEAYEHEYMGIPNGEGGAVFEFIESREITDDEIRNMDRLYAGVDWGWYPDPFAFILCYYNKSQEKIYLIDEYYVNKQKNTETAEWILKHHGEDIHALQYGVICDSAENKSIADFIDCGIFNAKAAFKPPGSVDYGMKWLQSRTIVIDPARTPNAFREITQYEYQRDKDDNFVSGYPDADNHTIDALRYALSPLFMRRMSQA